MDLSVDPEAVRAAASRLRDVADEARGAQRPQAEADVGNAGLTAAITAFASQVGAAWSDRVDEMDELARRVESSASVFEDSEQKAGDRIRRAR